MRTLPSVFLFFFACVAAAQSPFQFREATLLEQRMFRSGSDYTAAHGQIVGRVGPSPANQMIPDANDPHVYSSIRWLGLLNETDDYRSRGALALAEQQYLDLLSNLRKVQGPNSIDVGWMLDHLGEFYLSVNDFDTAYKYFSDAVTVRRANLKTIGTNQQLETTCEDHLARLQLMRGRLDFAKGDLARAHEELAEAIEIGDKYVRLLDPLHAVYFQSLVYEKEKNWQDAEAVWKHATERREKMTISDPYWDLMKEMAAFYARKGDFHTAAQLVQKIQTETAGKNLRPVMPIADSLAIRQGGHADEIQRWQTFYKSETEIAMAEIVAVNNWITNGPDAAATLLNTKPLNRLSFDESGLLDQGSDAQRARLLSFLTRRAWLHMSMLLDGDPTPQRVKQAYVALQPVKGYYLDSIAALTQAAESLRNNPHYSAMSGLSPVDMLDELAKQRTHYAHTFVAAALDKNKFSNVDFAASEQTEQAALEGLAHAEQYHYNTAPLEGDMSRSVPADAALIDFTSWERTSRTAPGSTQHEYGAFVTKKGQPTVYVKLGSATAIDGDVTALESMIVGPHVRGVVMDQPVPNPAQQTNERLRRLYQEVLTPLEPALKDVKKLLIVPDGKLALVPMGAFIDGRGHYLLQRFTVSYLSSWREVYLSGSPAAAANPPVIVANPDFDLVLPNSEKLQPVPGRMPFKTLPGAGLEAQDVAQALHVREDRVLTGKAAREQTIDALGAPEILHFATHSVPDLLWKIPTPAYDLFEFPKSLATDDPLLESVIVLAGGDRPQAGPEDGLLTGLEVASLRLSGTRLVVLSTCEAGQGTPVDGQGVLGLRAAFSMAGAKGLVMSLWPVDDKAGRLFMQFFYSHLGQGPAEAVQLSQMDMIAKTEFKQPVYWAGYAYSGDPAVNALAAPESAKTNVKNAPAPSADEGVVAPACIEFSTRTDQGEHYKHHDIYRLKIAGTLRRISASPQQVVYRLLPPSSNLEESHFLSINGQPEQALDPESANDSQFPVDVAITRTNEQSTFKIREYIPEGDHRYKPQDVLVINLSGGPNVLAGFYVPTMFPPLSSFSAATVTIGNPPQAQVEKISEIGVCPAQ